MFNLWTIHGNVKVIVVSWRCRKRIGAGFQPSALLAMFYLGRCPQADMRSRRWR